MSSYAFQKFRQLRKSLLDELLITFRGFGCLKQKLWIVDKGFGLRHVNIESCYTEIPTGYRSFKLTLSITFIPSDKAWTTAMVVTAASASTKVSPFLKWADCKSIMLKQTFLIYCFCDINLTLYPIGRKSSSTRILSGGSGGLMSSLVCKLPAVYWVWKHVGTDISIASAFDCKCFCWNSMSCGKIWTKKKFWF